MPSSEVWLFIYFLFPIIFGLGWYFGAKYEEHETKKKEKEREEQRHYEELIRRR